MSTLLLKRKKSIPTPTPEITTGALRALKLAQPEYLRPSYDMSRFREDQDLLDRARASINESRELIARGDDMIHGASAPTKTSDADTG